MPEQQQPPDAMPEVQPTKKERILGGLGGFLSGGTGLDFTQTPLYKKLEEHHQKRTDLARQQYHNATFASSILLTGMSPDRKSPEGDPLPLNEEEVRKYQNWFEGAMEEFGKIAGHSKEAKASIQKSRTIIDHLLKQARQRQAGAEPTGIPPPTANLMPSEQFDPGRPTPATSATPAAASGEPVPGGGVAEAPAERRGGMPVLPERISQPGYSPLVSMGMPELARRGEERRQDQREFGFWKHQQEVIRDFKIQEKEAELKAKAATPTGRAVIGPAISVSNARTLALQGWSFADKDGIPIDLTAIPDSMGLKNIIWGGKSYYEPFSPTQKVITVGNETYAISPMDVESLVHGAGTDVGQHIMPTTTRTTEPATGQTTVATRVPTTVGARGRGAVPALTTAAGTPPQRRPAAVPTQRAFVPTAKAPIGVPPLDAKGHIPQGVASPQVVEGANRLLGDADPEKLPAKTRALSSALARKYGWEQGRFTPKEQVLLKEATTFLQEAMNNPALSALDQGVTKRMQLGQILSDPEKMGMIQRGMTAGLAALETKEDAEFVRLYQQLVGTISGLTQLVRSGRATEATIHRLMRELPNPTQTSSSSDAKARIQRLLNEVNVAMEKGQFTGTTGMPGPPGRGVQKWGRDAQGKPIPLPRNP